MWELTDVNDKDVGWIQCFPCWVGNWGFKFISSILQLWSLCTVSPLSKLIQCWLISNWHLVQEVAQITLCSEPSILEGEVWVYVSFASVASEWPFFSIVNEWKLSLSFTELIFILCRLSKRLHKEAKWDWCLNWKGLLLGSLDDCSSHVLWTAISFINLNPWDSSRRWDVGSSWEEPIWLTRSDISGVKHLERSRHLVTIYFLVLNRHLCSCSLRSFALRSAARIIIWICVPIAARAYSTPLRDCTSSSSMIVNLFVACLGWIEALIIHVWVNSSLPIFHLCLFRASTVCIRLTSCANLWILVVCVRLILTKEFRIKHLSITTAGYRLVNSLVTRFANYSSCRLGLRSSY